MTLPLNKTTNSIEASTAGMAWAPSAIWDDATSQYYVFWSSRHYASSDQQHTGVANLDRIRYATTRDFVTFSAPRDYHSIPGTPIIDHEFVRGTTSAQNPYYTRFLKNETVNRVYQENSSTGGLFGTWTRVPGYLRPENENPLEGPAAFVDNLDPGTVHVWLDNYTEYKPFVTKDLARGVWTPETVSAGFPRGLKHGSVTPLTRREYDAFAAAYPAS